MPDLIDRTELIQEIINNKTSFIGAHNEVDRHDAMCDYALDYIKSAPAVDAVPVMHGHWIGSCGEHILPDANGEVGPEGCNCSRCGKYLGGSDEYTVNGKFCPWCGIKMDEKGSDSDGDN